MNPVTVVIGAGATRGLGAALARGFAAGGLRVNRPQSLARDYEPKGIHVAHVIVDGVIGGETLRSRFRECLGKLGPDALLDPDEVAQSYWFVHRQPWSAWTHELDLRTYSDTAWWNS